MASECDIIYVSQKAIKGNIIIEFLADWAVKDYELMNFDFPNQDLMTILEDEEEPEKKSHRKCTSTVFQML